MEPVFVTVTNVNREDPQKLEGAIDVQYSKIIRMKRVAGAVPEKSYTHIGYGFVNGQGQEIGDAVLETPEQIHARAREAER